jgi:hypothetical protein
MRTTLALLAVGAVLAHPDVDLLESHGYDGLHNFTLHDDWAVSAPLQEQGQHVWKRTLGYAWKSAPRLANSKVKTGVAAMQIAVVGGSHVLIIDKAGKVSAAEGIAVTRVCREQPGHCEGRQLGRRQDSSRLGPVARLQDGRVQDAGCHDQLLLRRRFLSVERQHGVYRREPWVSP